MLDRLEVRWEKTQYWSVDHENFVVNGVRLDALACQWSGEELYRDLIPGWGGVLSYPPDRAMVRKRVWPPVDGFYILPLLICPDDVDLSCTTVVTRVLWSGDVVVWDGLGRDRTGGPWWCWDRDLYCSEEEVEWEMGGRLDEQAEVDWFEGGRALRFEKSAYLDVVLAFYPDFVHV